MHRILIENMRMDGNRMIRLVALEAEEILSVDKCGSGDAGRPDNK